MKHNLPEITEHDDAVMAAKLKIRIYLAEEVTKSHMSDREVLQMFSEILLDFSRCFAEAEVKS